MFAAFCRIFESGTWLIFEYNYFVYYLAGCVGLTVKQCQIKARIQVWNCGQRKELFAKSLS